MSGVISRWIFMFENTNGNDCLVIETTSKILYDVYNITMIRHIVFGVIMCYKTDRIGKTVTNIFEEDKQIDQQSTGKMV